MPAATWSFSAATRTWKNSSRLDETDRAELDPLEQRDRPARRPGPARGVEVEPAQLSVDEAVVRASTPRRHDVGHARRPPSAIARRSLVAVGEPEIPLERDALALGVADDALAVAAELRVVAGQQHQAGQHPGAELLEHRAVALVAVDLPVRRHRAEVDDAGVGPRWLVDGDVGHGRRAYRSA